MSSQISYNYGGIWVGDGGTADLGENQFGPLLAAGPSGLACAATRKPAGALGCPSIVNLSTGPYGAALINTSASATVDAESVLWNTWDSDAGMPQVWGCADPSTLAGCTCHGPGCVADAGIPANISALYIEGNPHPFDFADGGLAPAKCGENCETNDAGVIVCGPV